ncbi:TetR/AcrR family transcriptional regulator [Frigoribacterium sp. CFBP 8759]|uniref:TetR/AcrR family transcriptional regulator n=1 Tax=Frigoribacterium sp. CFBP 8759 TaxID=2775283 RepID=UPI00177E78B9|nr:TetR/AcrR family transcriptional regulator [Frigoribacterium sp. CFBP 8759]MBD8486707.1 TetR/AcrR family transcriptional regulator [Frigoribacterium sp. CFBP 8759]
MPAADDPVRATRAPRRDATANRDALISAAALLLNRDPSVSLEAIAAEAGLSRRSVYGHFATRDDLVREVSLRGAARIGVAARPAPIADPVVQLASLAARLWAEVEHVRVMAQLTVRGPMAHEVGEALAPLRKTVRDVVRRGVESGRMRDDIAPHTLAHLVEGAALSVLDEATTQRLSRSEGHRLVMLAVLGVVGLDWRTAGDLVATAPELALPPEPATGASSMPPTGELA